MTPATEQGMSRRALRYGVAVLLCLLMTGCGTNLTKLFREDSRIYWEADHVVRTAEALDLGLETAAYAAELVQIEACSIIYEDLMEQLLGERKTSFWERLWSSLTQVVVLFVPVAPVQDCAKAQKKYKREINRLCIDLQAHGKSVICPD
jgi:hypothetical protein